MIVDLFEVQEEAERLNKEYKLFISIAKQKGNGIPLAVKDNICTKELPTTAGSKILKDYLPPYDATVITLAKEAGCSVIGKTAMDEFGFGSFSTNCAFGTPKNPLDPERTCGGSSGGSAAYIAKSELSRFSIAESTGGSISCPAAFCGTVGLTPTYGLVSRYGLIDCANSLDKIGTIGKSVKDAAFLLAKIAGYDPKDSTSLPHEKKDYSSYCNQTPKNIKIGVIKEYLESSDQPIKKKVWEAIHLLESNNLPYEEVSLSLPYAIPVYYIIAMAEASTNLARYCGLRYGHETVPNTTFNEYFSSIREQGFGKEAKRRIILGTFVRMSGWRDAYYIKAMKIRRRIIDQFKKLFATYDILLAPTMPFFPPKLNDIEKLTPLQHYQSDTLTVAPNLAGIPMLSLPVKEKTPVGIHLMANHLQEKKIIQLGAYYETIR